MGIYKNQKLDEERALYGISFSSVTECTFDGPADGESALKECRNITVEKCFFNLRYPLWHTEKAVIRNSKMTENCRAALWYDKDIVIENTVMNGIKALRECSNVSLTGCEAVSPEFLWRCRNINIKDTSITSEYPFFECSDLSAEGLRLKGKYSFQYVENAVIKNSILDTKDAFWHSKNVTVCDSVVNGEYLGWYAENLRLVRCRIAGTQPLCYCSGLVLEDCTMDETDFSFEKSQVNADIRGKILGVKNPLSGRIKADEIGELLLDTAYCDPEKTEICCDKIQNRILL